MDAIDGLKYIASELRACRMDLADDNNRALGVIMDGYDQASHHAEQLSWMREAERVLSEATKRPITSDEAKLLAWAGNLQFNQQEVNHEMG